MLEKQNIEKNLFSMQFPIMHAMRTELAHTTCRIDMRMHGLQIRKFPIADALRQHLDANGNLDPVRGRILVENNAITSVFVPLGTGYGCEYVVPNGTMVDGMDAFFYQHDVPNGTCVEHKAHYDELKGTDETSAPAKASLRTMKKK
jgi:hypothetical protein